MGQTEMASVAALKHVSAQVGDEHWLSSKLAERVLQPCEVFRLRQHGQVDVAAELGGAVQNAGLASHQDRAHPKFPQSRKEFANRDRVQGNLPGPDKWTRSVTAQRAAD